MKECQQCGVLFKEERPDQLYCNKTHARRARRNRSKEARRDKIEKKKLVCPTPQKLFFSNKDTTWSYIWAHTLPLLIPYKCPCGMWHMKTVSLNKRLKTEAAHLRKDYINPNVKIKTNPDNKVKRPSIAEARKNTPF